MDKPVLLAMFGLPRSGKTTICKRLMRELGAPVVNQDSVRLALHGHRYLGKAEPLVKAVTNIFIDTLFLTGHPLVICDETNYSRAKRDTLKNPRWDTYFYEVPTTPEVCIERAIATEQPDLIPVIEEMWKRREDIGDDEKAITNLDQFIDAYQTGLL